MRALVTGGAGFIGSHVVDDLCTAGHEVAVIDDLSTGRRENVPTGVELVELDIRDGEAVDAAFARLRPELVSHHAAQTSVAVSVRAPRADAMANVIGTINVLEAARHHGVRRMIFASTGGAIYGEVPDGKRAGLSHTKPVPWSGYACAKLAAESYLDYYGRAHGLATATLRYANVYGPRQDPHGEAGVVAIFVDRLHRGEPLQINAGRTPGDDGCIRDYVFVGDVVRAHRLAAGGDCDAEILDVGTGVGTTTRTLALELARVMNVELELRDAPPREATSSDRCSIRRASNSAWARRHHWRKGCRRRPMRSSHTCEVGVRWARRQAPRRPRSTRDPVPRVEGCVFRVFFGLVAQDAVPPARSTMSRVMAWPCRVGYKQRCHASTASVLPGCPGDPLWL